MDDLLTVRGVVVVSHEENIIGDIQYRYLQPSLFLSWDLGCAFDLFDLLSSCLNHVFSDCIQNRTEMLFCPLMMSFLCLDSPL